MSKFCVFSLMILSIVFSYSESVLAGEGKTKTASSHFGEKPVIVKPYMKKGGSHVRHDLRAKPKKAKNMKLK